MAEPLNDSVVRQLEVTAPGNRITFDATVKGFGVRWPAAGATTLATDQMLNPPSPGPGSARLVPG